MHSMAEGRRAREAERKRGIEREREREKWTVSKYTQLWTGLTVMRETRVTGVVEWVFLRRPH